MHAGMTLKGPEQLVSKRASCKARFASHNQMAASASQAFCNCENMAGMEESHLRIPGWR